MGFLEALFGSKPDTVESLTAETTSFLTKFGGLVDRNTNLLATTQGALDRECEDYRGNLATLKAEYDKKLHKEDARHDKAATELEADIVGLKQNITVAEKVLSFFG